MGHEYLKRQLSKEGDNKFEALDNGVLSCAEPHTAASVGHGVTRVTSR